VSLADEEAAAQDEPDSEDGQAELIEVEVLECNLDAVRAFQLCQVQGIGTMAGIFWTGIDPSAIRSTLLLLRLPRERWSDIAQDVSYMGDVVASHRNEQMKAPKRR
jgi:hypothetical protein